ncbi:GAF domain-containing protein, partial [Planctomycetota bacterium]
IARIEAGAVEFARDLSRTFTKLKEWQRPHAVSQFIAEMALASDKVTLFNICVTQIPRLLGTRYCSIFEVVREKKRTAPRLVLRRTNFEASQNREGTIAYKKGEGLTGWVWNNSRSLRIDNIKDKSELAKYPGLEWSNTICDSDHHREWLGVPLFGWQGDVIGVIRVPEKRKRQKRTRSGGGFSFKDEVLLLTIGKHVARQIEDLSAKERIGTALRASQECAVRLGQAANANVVGETLVNTCKQIFGTDGKLHAFIVLTDDKKHFRVEACAGSLGSRYLDAEFPAEESQGALVLRKRRAVIIHNVTKAQKRKQYYPAVGALACAMSAPVCFGDKMYGVLSVGADKRYEFSEAPDLRIVRDLAIIAGATLERLDAERASESAFSEFSKRMGHVLNSRITVLEGTIASTKKDKRLKQPSEIVELKQVVEFLKCTADLAVRFGQAWDRADFHKFDVASRIAAIETLWKDERVKVSVTGPLLVVGNPELFEHAVVELVGNALRFIQKDGGKVVVRGYRRHRRRTTLDPPAVIVEVEDNGPGVSEEQKESIFNPYRTSDESRTGLGLSIVRSIVEAHKGHVEEKGAQGHGACFRIVLPYA